MGQTPTRRSKAGDVTTLQLKRLDPDFTRIVRFAYLIPLVLLAILGGVLALQLNDVVSDYRAVDHSDLVRIHTNRALRMLVDSETGVRGYLLVGDRTFLQPYQAAAADINNEFDELAKLLSDDAEQKGRLEQLRSGCEDWLAYAQRMIQERAPGGNYADVKQNLIGKQKMDSLRDRFEEIQQVELKIREQRDIHTHHAATATLVTGSVLTLLSGLFLAFLTRRKVLTIVRRSEGLLEQANQSERDSQRMNRTLQMMSACRQELVRALNEHELLQSVCQAIVDIGGYRLAWVGYAKHDDGKSMHPEAVAGDDRGYVEQANISWGDDEHGQGPCGRAIRSGQVQVVRNTDTDEPYGPWRAEAKRRGFASSIGLPLLSDGSVMGCLSIYAAQCDAFDEEETRLLSQLAHDLAYGIHALRMAHERKQNEQQLQASEARLRLAVEAAYIGTFDWDIAHNGIVWSHWHEALWGFRPGEFPGTFKAFADRVHPEDLTGINAEVARCIGAHEPFSREFRVVWPDGSMHWVYARGEFAYDDAGQALRMHGVVMDISERKHTEEALRQNEQRLRQATRVSRTGIFDHDHLKDTIYWSPEQRAIYGFDPDEEVTLSKYLDHVYCKDRAVIAAAVEHAHDPAVGGLFDVEHRIVRRDGSIRWLTTRAQTFFEGEGAGRHKVRTIGAVLDITERRQLEEDQQKLIQVVQNSPDFIGIATPDGKVLFVNEAGQKLVGLENNEQVASTVVVDYLPSDEHARFAREIIPQLISGESWWGEVLLQHFRNGEKIPVEMRAFPISDAERNVIAIANVSRDNRGRKQSEKALRQAEEKYRGIFENAVLGIFQSTPEGRYLSVNSAMARMYGYNSPGDMTAAITDIGRQEFVDPSKRHQFMRLLEEQGAVHDFVFEIYRKDGSVGWVSVNARALREGENVIYYEGTQEDVTERKRAEQALREQSEQLRALATRLQQVREEERTMLARDLHDQIAQILTAVRMDVSWLAKRLSPEQQELQDRIESTVQLVSKGAQSVRRICTELRPGILDDLGLAAAIEWQANEFAVRTGIRCEVSVPPADLHPDGESATALFRIFQEALTNVARHAEARAVISSLSQQGKDLLLMVQDDGKGIRGSDESRSLGILGMKERAQVCGGELKVSGSPGHGTTVAVRVPLCRKPDQKREIAVSRDHFSSAG